MNELTQVAWYSALTPRGNCRIPCQYCSRFYLSCILTRFGSEILFSNQKRASVWKTKTNGEVEAFAGCEKEEGSVDRKVKDCRFQQPIGLCTESESIIYICDA